MLLGIILKLKGNPPAGDGGLQCSVKEGTHSANKVSNTFFFSHGSVPSTAPLLSLSLTRFTGGGLSLFWQSYTPDRAQVCGRV